jgi:AAA domain
MSQKKRISTIEDIPNIFTLDIPPAEYIVPALGIARNTITLWTGSDGDGKTYLAQVMALAVARGDDFLGMRCQEAPVLYIDLENPGYVVQERLQALTNDQLAPANLHFWGMWLPIDQQPPQFGSELLLTICKEAKPLLIVDPFRYFHNAEENDSTAMAGVMQYLRACAAYGSAVVILHHPSKGESASPRGSSAIRGACDLAFLHTLDREADLITLRVDKNRLGPSRTITLRADFEEGRFEMVDAPYITRRNDELAKLEEIIKANPGMSQTAVWKESGGQRNRIFRLLKEGIGTRWTAEKDGTGAMRGGTGAMRYRMLANSWYPKAGTAGTTHSVEGGTAVPTPLGVVPGTARNGSNGSGALPSCPNGALPSGEIHAGNVARCVVEDPHRQPERRSGGKQTRKHSRERIQGPESADPGLFSA